MSALYRFFILDEGSTRSVAIVRIGLVFLLWANFAERLLLWRTLPGGLGPNLSTSESVAMTALAALFYVSTTSMLIGFYSRVSTLLTALTQIGTILVLGAYFGQKHWLHHYTQLLYLSTLILACTPCGRSLSVDRWRDLRRGRAQEERAPLTAQRLLCVLVASMYLWTAIDKMRIGFLNGDDLERFYLWYFADSDMPQSGVFFAVSVAASIATVVLELALAGLLWHPRARPWMVLLGTAFHLVIYLTMEVYTFSLTCILLYLLFFDADRVHAVIDRLFGTGETRLSEP